MLVARIKEIVMNILSSIYLLMTFIVFISYVPIYTCDTNNDKYTNFKEYNNNIIWTHNEDDVEKVPTNLSIVILKVMIYGINFVVCCLLLHYFWRCNRERIYYILYYLNNLYNWLFRRNQGNEPAVHYRDSVISWIGRETSV